MASVCVVILTYNEEIHIKRAISSVASLAQEILVVDSFSTDRTVEIAEAAGARVLQRPFSNYARQFAWAIEQSGSRFDWLMRLDADEYLGGDFGERLARYLIDCPEDVTGINLKRRHFFMGRWIRHGGRYPLILLRLWRHGCAQIEDRWMDEHMVLSCGRAITMDGVFIDDNLKSLSFFVDKHNKYATREAVDVLMERYHLGGVDAAMSSRQNSRQAAVKRWLKTRIYNRLPMWAGPLAYFCLRYFVQCGFLDGKEGQIYHSLQGLWYRYLVAAKVEEFDRLVRSASGKSQQISVLSRVSGLCIDNQAAADRAP